MRVTVKELKCLIKESLIVESMAQASRDIIAASNGSLRSSGTKRGAIRLAPVVTGTTFTDDQINDFFQGGGFDVIKVMLPPTQWSSKFPVYVIQSKESQKKYSVVFGGGRNVGQAYEDELNTELKSVAEGVPPSERVKKLLKALGVRVSQIVDVQKASVQRVRRPITKNPQNVGPDISDMTIVLNNGKNVYISLKNKTGSTFANGGYKGGFKVVEDRIVSSRHPLDEFVEALGVDKRLAAKGYTSYMNGIKEKTPGKINPKQNFKTVENFLKGAFGYGYWYVREKGDGFDVKDINNKRNLNSLLGDVVGIELRYPGKTKQITAIIETTKATYVVEIRNSHGEIDPNEIKVKIR